MSVERERERERERESLTCEGAPGGPIKLRGASGASEGASGELRGASGARIFFDMFTKFLEVIRFF